MAQRLCTVLDGTDFYDELDAIDEAVQVLEPNDRQDVEREAMKPKWLKVCDQLLTTLWEGRKEVTDTNGRLWQQAKQGFWRKVWISTQQDYVVKIAYRSQVNLFRQLYKRNWRRTIRTFPN